MTDSATIEQTDKQVKRLSDYQVYSHIIDKLELDFQLDPIKTTVTSNFSFRNNPDAAKNDSMWLDGEELKLVSVALNGVELSVDRMEVTATGLRLRQLPNAGTITIITEINPSANTKLSGLYVSRGKFCSQCEAEGFHRITYFPDRPDVMTRYRVSASGDVSKTPIILSNGNLISKQTDQQGRLTAVWEDPHPKPCYLFALVAGKFDVLTDTFTTQENNQVELGIYVEPGRKHYAKWAMHCLKQAMLWDEKVYRRCYDLGTFNIVAVNDFNFGAMENKGLNIFNDKYLLVDPATATDQDYANVERVVAHEYFHNWTGNRITCRDWFQLCLKEGLTVYRDQQFAADMRGEASIRIADVDLLRCSQFIEDQGPLAHPVRPESYIEINNFYTATVYEKGAELIRMLATLIGREKFFAGMELYFSRHDGQAVTMEDFIKAMADAAGRDLSQFFLWYQQPGVPRISAQYIAGNDSDSDSTTWTWEISQSQPNPVTAPVTLNVSNDRGESKRRGSGAKNGEVSTRQPLLIPVSYAVFDRTSGTKLQSGMLNLTAARQTLQVTCKNNKFTAAKADDKSSPILSLNRGFAAPIIVASPQQHSLLARYESDPFIRWEAIQSLAKDLILNPQATVKDADGFDYFCNAIAKVITDQKLADEVKATLIAIPRAKWLMQEMKPIEPIQLADNIRSLVNRLSKQLQQDVLPAYRNISIAEAYQPSAAQCGARRFRLILLRMLAEIDPDHALRHFQQANNMTDTLGSLSILAELPEHDQLIEQFRQRYSDHPLVMDEIVRRQVSTRRSDTLAIAKRIYHSDWFDRNNPNRLYSLLGGLNASLWHLHARDGSGYDFICEIIIEKDDFNPQLAARFAREFAQWHKFASPFREAQQRALQQMAAKPNISSDLYEIVAKSLQH